MWLMIMLNCNNNDQILFEREVSNNSIKLNCVTELLIHRIPSNCIFFKEGYTCFEQYTLAAGQSRPE